MNDEILATVSASAPRRWLGVGMMGTLGVLLLYIALAVPPQSFSWQAFLLVMGVGSLWLADATRRATERVVELRHDGLSDSTGAVIAPLDQLASIDRGTFAMKPSNGFVIRLSEKRPRAWQPGLWWAIGSRVGIGGVTPGSQTKAMAQILEMLLAERQSGQDDQTS